MHMLTQSSVIFQMSGTVVRKRFNAIAVELRAICMKWTDLVENSQNAFSRLADCQILLLDTRSSASVDFDFDVNRTYANSEGFSREVAEAMESLAYLVARIGEVEKNLNALQSLESGLPTPENLSRDENMGIDLKSLKAGAAEIGEMLSKELSCKQAIVEQLAVCSDRDQVMFCTAAWAHQPYLDDRVLCRWRDLLATLL